MYSKWMCTYFGTRERHKSEQIQCKIFFKEIMKYFTEWFSQCVDANSQLPLEGSGLQFCCDTVYDATPWQNSS